MRVSMPTKSSNVIVDARFAAREVRERFAAQIAQRQAARNILAPDEVAGEYDAGRLLSTTLGGVPRAITNDDLATFRRTAQALGKRFTGGITAKSVIDLSASEDRERSNMQIRVAVPVQRMGNDIHFVTNAGPHSDVVRHNVHIQLLNLDAAVASPSKAEELVKMVTSGKIRMNCDCDHFRYRLRYIATIGRYNAGVPETGYPKWTNPNLVGIACKHILRVVQQLQSPMVRAFVVKMIEVGRKSVAPKLVAVAKKDAVAMAHLQAKQANWKRNAVESATEKRLRLAQQRQVKEIAARTKRAMPKTPQQMATARRKFEQSARLLAAMGGITQKQLSEMLAKLGGR